MPTTKLFAADSSSQEPLLLFVSRSVYISPRADVPSLFPDPNQCSPSASSTTYPVFSKLYSLTHTNKSQQPNVSTPYQKLETYCSLPLTRLGSDTILRGQLAPPIAMFGNSFSHKARTALFLLLTATAPTNALGINWRGSSYCDFFPNPTIGGNEAKVVRQHAHLVPAPPGQNILGMSLGRCRRFEVEG